jgi:hypothetical protein
MFLLTRCSLFADRPPPPPSGNRLTGTVEDRGGTAPLPASGPAGPVLTARSRSFRAGTSIVGPFSGW